MLAAIRSDLLLKLVPLASPHLQRSPRCGFSWYGYGCWFDVLGDWRHDEEDTTPLTCGSCCGTLRIVSTEFFKSFEAGSWNACLKALSRPLDSLDAVQRPAARVFEYYGRVMNGGHLLHFDVHGDSRDEELLQALKSLGADRHARILAEAFFLRREVKRGRGEEDYVSESIEQLDIQFGELRPDIPELLALYFKAHPESFPVLQ